MNLKGECIMQEALIQIVLYTIKENYQTEKDFFSSQLSISQENWERWKNGEISLKPKDEQTIINLFTDYEWMLVQKVIRNATFFPEVEANPVEEYVGIKFHVAKKWVNSGTAELAFQQENEKESDGQHRKKNSTVLKIDMNYDFWSYKDRIELSLPGIIQQQIETEKQDLLEWFKENIEDHYVI